MSSTQVSKPTGPLEKILVTGATGQQGGTLAKLLLQKTIKCMHLFEIFNHLQHMAKWWNWWEDHPTQIAHNWPVYLKQNEMIGNRSVVFLANPAYSDEKNTNARNQNCEISSNQILYLTLYPGECSAFEAKESSVSKLLECAIDSNLVIKLNQVKVDGKDVSSNIISQRTTRPFNFVIPSVNVDAAEPSTPGKVNPSMAENYYLFFKPLPAGHHTIEAELIRQPLQSNQPVEQHTTKWNVNVAP